MFRHRLQPFLTGAASLIFALAAAGTAPASAQAASPPAARAQGSEQASAELAPGAADVIDALHVELLEVMKGAEELGYNGREQKLAVVLPQHFDVEFMARKSLGRYWAQSGEEDRARYLETFERFMVANYAGRFDGWSGQSFVVEGQTPAGRGTVLVQSRLINPDDDDVELKYRLRPVNGSWKIIDVFLDGTVSELALRYSEFVGIVKREDLDALITAIDERIAKLASSGSS